VKDGQSRPYSKTTHSRDWSFSPCIHNARRPSPLMMSSPYPPHKPQSTHACHDTSTNRTHRPPPLATGIRSITVLLNCLLQSINPSLCKPFHRPTKKVILHQSESSSYHAVLSSPPTPHPIITTILQFSS